MATPKPRSTKIYRFALFGRRNAGKTCILAALAMERLANPKQFACTWIDRPGPNLLASLRATDPGAADGFTHYLQPDGSGLFDRGVYSMEEVRAEGMKRTSPEMYAQQVKEGYPTSTGPGNSRRCRRPESRCDQIGALRKRVKLVRLCWI